MYICHGSWSCISSYGWQCNGCSAPQSLCVLDDPAKYRHALDCSRLVAPGLPSHLWVAATPPGQYRLHGSGEMV